VFTGSGRRREWLPEEKARIVSESYEAGTTVSAVANEASLAGKLGEEFPGFVFSAVHDSDEYWCFERSVVVADGSENTAALDGSRTRQGPRRRRYSVVPATAGRFSNLPMAWQQRICFFGNRSRLCRLYADLAKP
jgi:hypothetical protein